MSGASRDGRDWYNRQSRQWRNLGIAISIAFFIAIFVVGPAALLPTQENDALTVLRLAQDARYVDGAGGYYITALISASLSKDMQQAIVFILGIIFIYRVHRDLRNPYTVGLAVFLLIAPTVLFLTLFMKDSSIPALTLLTLITLQSQRHDIVKVLVVAVIYGAYGLIFRQYYLLVVGIFFVLVFGSRIPPIVRILLVVSAAAIMFLVPDNTFSALQDSRDLVNRWKLGRDIAGARTAFGNPLPPDDLFNFVYNYIYATLRLNFPLFFDFTFRSLFLAVNVIVYAYLTWLGLKIKDPKIRLPSLLFLAHFFVMMLFEPDLGSYFRHVSSVLLYVIPALTILDKRLKLGRKSSLSQVKQADALL